MLTSAGETPAELFARSMSELLVQSLVAHTHIRVVGPIDSVRDAATSATNGGVSGVLTGHVSVRDGRLSLAVRVVDASTSTVVWSSLTCWMSPNRLFRASVAVIADMIALPG